MDKKEKDPLAQIVGPEGRKESRLANQAFRDYCYMGAARSLRKLQTMYKTRIKNGEKPEPPTDSWATLSDWSGSFNWVERAKAFDKQMLAKDQRAYEDRRRKLLESGLALDFERVAKLNGLFEKLEGYLEQEDRVWLPDAKMIGTFPNQERVDFVRFNSPLIEQIRATLADIAAEVGGRVKNVDVKSNGQPIETVDDSKFDLALSTLADAIREIVPGKGAEQDGPVGASEQTPVAGTPVES